MSEALEMAKRLDAAYRERPVNPEYLAEAAMYLRKADKENAELRAQLEAEIAVRNSCARAADLNEQRAESAERRADEMERDAGRLDWMDTLQHRADGKWPIASDCHAHHGKWSIYVRTGIGSKIAAEGWGDTIREAIDEARKHAQEGGL